MKMIIVMFSLWFAAIVGWIANLYQVIVYLLALNSITAISGLAILKAIGILLAPVGAVLGWFGFFI